MLKYNGTLDERIDYFVPCMSTSATTESYYRMRSEYLEKLVCYLEDSLLESGEKINNLERRIRSAQEGGAIC